MKKTTLHTSALSLLQQLISIPSFSREEDATADCISKWLLQHDIKSKRYYNNIYAFNKHFDPDKPTLLLNSHHDSVRPNAGYARDPFFPEIENGKLYGLGSNDAGGCLVGLLACFVYFYEQQGLSHNLVIVASAEEENSGERGLASVLPKLPTIAIAIVGEPTQMHPAIAEKGLVVLDVVVEGTASHAAHHNDDHAIYKTIPVLEWFRDFRFDKVSEHLGPVKMTVSQITAGQQHNAVPAKVDLTVDVRVNDCYTNNEVLSIIQQHCPCSNITARSLDLNPSSIPSTHPLVQQCIALGKAPYGSPTVSDQAVLRCPSIKLGPGNSLRSHTADEYLYLQELEEGVAFYIQLLESYLLN